MVKRRLTRPDWGITSVALRVVNLARTSRRWGVHLAADVSHTTGRSHTLGFRAASAVFGHQGIEWDLRQATDDQLSELRSWIDFHKQHRALLHGGDMVRLDSPDESMVGHGVVAPDESSALYSLAPVGRSDASMLGRLRLPGLDPHRRYRIRPVMPGGTLPGLVPPPLWGIVDFTANDTNVVQTASLIHDIPGTEMIGQVLATVELAHPGINPEQVVLYLVEGLQE